MWYGWALREAFKAGIEQQMQAIAASQQAKCAERMPLLLTNPYFDNENPFASVWASGSREQRDADWQWHLADKAEAIKQFKERLIREISKKKTYGGNEQSTSFNRGLQIALKIIRAEKEAGKW